MLKKIIFGLGLSLVLVAGLKSNYFFHPPTEGALEFSSQPAPASIPEDLLLGSQKFLSFVSDSKAFTFQNCAPSLYSIYTDLNKINPEYFNQETIKSHYQEIIRNLYLSRVTLRQRLKEFVDQKLIIGGTQPEDTCVTEVRNIFRAARYIEDYLGEVYLGVKPFNPETDPVAYGTFTREEPWLQKSPGVDQITLRSGDLIMSRGNVFTSAAIARIGNVNSQFSHLAFVYIDGDDSGQAYPLAEILKNPKAYVLEAHIELGSTVRTVAAYLKDGNARNVLFRLPDAKLAHAAAKYSYKKITDYSKEAYENYKTSPGRFINPLRWMLPKEHPNFNLPYDFNMNVGSSAEVFCSEIASMGFNSPEVNFKLPLFETALPSAEDNDIVKVLGINAKRTFAPGDMEVDTRFEMLAEWRDYRRVQNLRYKDAVLVSMYHWMKKYNYKIFVRIDTQIGANLFWDARWLDIPRLSIGGEVIFDASKSIPKNMSAKMAATVVTLNKIGEALELFLKKEEKIYLTQHQGLPMPYQEMLNRLEKYRAADYEKFHNFRSSEFHNMFFPENESHSVENIEQ